MSATAAVPEASFRRIFVVVWWLAEFGGMEEHVTALACALADAGVVPVVLSQMPLPRANGYRARLEAAGIRVIAPPVPAGLTHAMRRSGWIARARRALASQDPARAAAQTRPAEAPLPGRRRKQVRRVLWILLAPAVLAERALRAAGRAVRGRPRDPAAPRDFVDRFVFHSAWPAALDGATGRGGSRLRRAPRDWAQRLADLVRGDPTRAWLLRALAREGRSEPPDVVHVHGFRVDQAWMVPSSVARGWPTLYTEHGTLRDARDVWNDDAAALLRCADALACVSATSRDALYALLPERPYVAVARHLVRAPAKDTAGTRRAAGEDAVTLVCVARLSAAKGIDPLLRAFVRVAAAEPSVRLVLAGDGEERPAFAALAAELGIAARVVFRGRFQHAQLSAILAAAEIVVLASYTEGLPLALVEAMAHGKAIVATRVGGIPDLLADGETALLVPPGHVDALADALLRLVTAPALRARLGDAARRAFAQGEHRAEAVLPATFALYDRARRHRAASA